MEEQSERAMPFQHSLLSPVEFSSQIESRNMPVVFSGCVSDWAAIKKWNPITGGLDYLQVQVGSSRVEAMLSRSGSVFYGDIRSHDRISILFSSFINLCKKSERNQTDSTGDKHNQDQCNTLDYDSSEGLQSYLEAGSQIFLAQVPIFVKDHKGELPLEGLLEDIYMPRFLEPDPISSINLWMNVTHSRSSTHYDPNHNLLCVIAGCKRVVLWPPCATKFLYPKPVWGEASNHSAVDIVEPNFEVYPLAKHAWDHCRNVELRAGDALFIPEGWFHQVDSDDLTIAVNFWWPSRIMLAMQAHMDGYYLRRIISRLVDNEKEQMIKAVSTIDNKQEGKYKLDDNTLAISDVEMAEKKHLKGYTDAGQCTELMSFGKCNIKEEPCSLFQENNRNRVSDTQVSGSEDYCRDDLISRKSIQSPNMWENSTHKTEIRASTVVFSDSDININLAPSEDVSDIVDKKQDFGAMACWSGDLRPCNSNPSASECNLNEIDFQNDFVLQKLDCFEAHLLNDLISSVHAKINGAVQNRPQDAKKTDQAFDQKERSASEFSCFSSSVAECSDVFAIEDDTVANILGQLKPLMLKKLLLVMMNQFPRTLEALITHGLSPTAAEILTYKFDQMEKEVSKDEQEEFYRLFYSVFDDQHAAMETILNGKELFAFQELKKVINQYLGLKCEWSRS